jgi:hypothetical protein
MIAAGEALVYDSNGLVDPWSTSSTASAATGASQAGGADLGAGMMGMGISSAITATGKTVCAIANYVSQQNLLEIKERVAIARYDHQDRMTSINKETQLININAKQEKMHIQREGQKELHQAVEERKKAEDQVKIAEAKEKELKLTEKTGKVNKKALNKIFSTYSYGNPMNA